jgi:MFS family permease
VSTTESRPDRLKSTVDPALPGRPWLVVGLSALAGFVLTVLWSARFVDSVIGDNVANTLLGYDAENTEVTGIAAGIAFAFVTGLAGTFTACNIAVFGTMAPVLGRAPGWRDRGRATLGPLLWLAAGMVAVSAVYGAIVGLAGTSMPQFSTAPSVPGELSARSIQSMVVFGLIGLALLYLGLAALKLVPDPFAGRYRARMVFLGVLVGGFLIGRPFPLFRHMFRDAAERGDPLYGAAAFVLQSVGNVLVMAVLLVVVAAVFGGRIARFLAADPRRAAVLTAAGLIVAGVFTVMYWDVRLLANRDLIWYPKLWS